MAKTAKLPRTSRKVEGSALMTVTLERIPRALVERAKEKCKREIPPVTLKAKMIVLLDTYVERFEPKRT